MMGQKSFQWAFVRREIAPPPNIGRVNSSHSAEYREFGSDAELN